MTYDNNIVHEQHYSYHLDPHKQPALSIYSGENVTFKTTNAFNGKPNNEEEINLLINSGYHHPFTGPVYVEGAKKGNTLGVTINHIQLDNEVFQCLSRSSGVLPKNIEGRNFKKFIIADNVINFEGINLQITPSVGGIGLGDPDETRNGALGCFGGNFDFNYIKSDTTLYFPVDAAGGLLYMGDLHALQGNGEVSGISLEASGQVNVTINKHDKEISTPLIHSHSDNVILVPGHGQDINEAIKQAVYNTVSIVQKSKGLAYEDAYMLVGGTCDLIIGHLTGRIKSASMKIPNTILDIQEII